MLAGPYVVEAELLGEHRIGNLIAVNLGDLTAPGSRVSKRQIDSEAHLGPSQCPISLDPAASSNSLIRRGFNTLV